MKNPPEISTGENQKDTPSQFNIVAHSKALGIPLWQYPQFLFLVMGIVIIGTSIAVYAIGTRYIEDPLTVALIVLALSLILLIIAFTITQSFERLAEASRLKSEFISVVSHQLRSPLSNLNWAVDLIMSGRLGKVERKQAEYFQILRENTSRMAQLVGDLLIVSRLETGKLPLKKKEFSLEEVARELISEFEPFSRASNVTIELKAETDIPLVFADLSQVKVVIENLLDNAIRYIKDSGRVEISIEKRGSQLYFGMKDNGVGVPKKDQKYIFQKFFRSENVLRYQTQGSGLGLYITKSILEKSGGKIGFSSEENKGSTFWFTLPIK